MKGELEKVRKRSTFDKLWNSSGLFAGSGFIGKFRRSSSYLTGNETVSAGKVMSYLTTDAKIHSLINEKENPMN